MWQGLFSLGSKTFYTRRKQRLKMIWYAREALWTSLILNSMEIQSFTHSNVRVLWTLSWTGFRQIIPWFNLTDFWYKHLFDLFWFKVQFYRSPSCRYMYSYLTRLMWNINNLNRLQLMQIIWNVMLYSQHFTFHWNLLVVIYYGRIPISRTFGFSNLPITRTKPDSFCNVAR